MNNDHLWEWILLSFLVLGSIMLRAILKKDPFEGQLPHSDDQIVKNLKEKLSQKKAQNQQSSTPYYIPLHNLEQPYIPQALTSHQAISPITTPNISTLPSIQPNTHRIPPILNQKGLISGIIWSEVILKRSLY